MLTIENIENEIRRIAAENPEYVYDEGDAAAWGQRCYYVRNGCGSCIVGRALANLGVPIERLEEADSRNGSGVRASTLLTELTGKSLVAARWVQYVQDRQDKGVAWREAVAQADAVIG